MASTRIPTLNLGPGVDMPVVGLGTFNNLKKEGREVYEAVKAAIDAGYRHIDCAWVYKSEEEIGDAIAEKIKEGTVSRKDLFVTTKLWNFFHYPDKVEAGLDESLKALQLDYVDLFLMHWPMAWQEPADRGVWIMSSEIKAADVDFVDTWRAIERLLDTGKVKAIGVSNFNQSQLTRLLKAPALKVKPCNLQIEIHPYLANSELLDLCKKHGISVTAFSPLSKAGGPYAGGTAPNVLEEPALKSMAAKHGKSPAQVALRWGLQRGYAIVPKSVTPSRIKENLDVVDFSLDEEEMKAISALDKGQRVVTVALFKDYPEYPF